MTQPPTVRYINRRSHECGCVTVWDVHGGGPRYEQACSVHRGYAQRFSTDSLSKE